MDAASINRPLLQFNFKITHLWYHLKTVRFIKERLSIFPIKSSEGLSPYYLNGKGQKKSNWK